MPTKSKRIIRFTIIGVITVLSLLFVAQIKGIYSPKRKLAVKSIDQQGVFVGDESKVFTEQPNRVDQEIDYVWDQIHIAGKYEKERLLVKAADHYRNAFHGLSNDVAHVIPGRSMAATYLVKVYEKLGQYNDALVIVDWLEDKVYKSDSGRKYCAETRSRLLAAKAQAEASNR